VSQAPLWVCPECRRNIEEEERRAAMEPSMPMSLQVHVQFSAEFSYVCLTWE